ncbi:MAG: hypothetical protein KY468_19805 [Armatimonadetes bacterium]|nr:hypothetical protein [Armatimonadota bacterium]
MPPRLTSPAPSSLSPIRVAPGGRYFETFEGEPFLFLGPNDAVSWPGLNGLFPGAIPRASTRTWGTWRITASRPCA